MRLDIPDCSDDWIQPNEMLFPVLLEHVENLQDILDLHADYADNIDDGDISFNSVTVSEASSGVDSEEPDSEEIICYDVSVSEDSYSDESSSDENDEFELPIPVFTEELEPRPPPPPVILLQDEVAGRPLDEVLAARNEESTVGLESSEYGNLFPNLSLHEESSNDEVSRAELLSVISSNRLYSLSPVNPPCSPVSESENSNELYAMQNSISDSSQNFEEIIPPSHSSTNEHDGSETAALNDAISLGSSDQLVSLSVSDTFMQFDQSSASDSDDEYSDDDDNISAIGSSMAENLNKTQDFGAQPETSPKSVSNLKRKVDPVNDDVINKFPKFTTQNDSNCNKDSLESYCKVFSSGCSSDQSNRGDKTDSKQSSVCGGNLTFDKPIGNIPEEQGKSKS